MAHIQRRKRNGKTVWRARYRTPTGQERSRSFARKFDAEQWLAGVQADIARGEYVDPRSSRITLAEYAEQWQRAQVHRDSTATATSSLLRNHVLPAFGHRPLGSILPSEVQAWVKEQTESASAATVEGRYRLLATLLRSAVADRLIGSSPCHRIRLPDKDNGQVKPLTLEQVAALRELMPEHAKAIITVAAGTGMRQGEILGLTADRVDFLRRTITIDRQLVKKPNGQRVLGPPKTKSSNRTIPVPDVVLEELSAHLATFPSTHPWGLAFTNRRDDSWNRTGLSKLWRRAADRAGLPPGARFHDLRHHAASLLIAAGCSIKVVQTQLGHASASETLDTYSHLWPTDNERVRSAVNEAFRTLQPQFRGEAAQAG